MKRSLLALIPLVMACSTPDSVPANALVGTWRLTTYCKPTGATTCSTVNVPADKGVFVMFGRDGTFTETYENTKYEGYGFLGCPGGYAIENNDVRITTACMSSLGGKLVKLVSVTSTQLVLNPYGTGEYVLTR